MTALRFMQLHCEGHVCISRYPDHPEVTSGNRNVTVLRVEAAEHGWEVMRGKHGRDLCPSCRIREIRELSAELPAEGRRQ